MIVITTCSIFFCNSWVIAGQRDGGEHPLGCENAPGYRGDAARRAERWHGPRRRTLRCDSRPPLQPAMFNLGVSLQRANQQGRYLKLNANLTPIYYYHTVCVCGVRAIISHRHTGDFSPSGRLPYSVVESAAQLPPYGDMDLLQGRTCVFVAKNCLSISSTIYISISLSISPSPSISPSISIYIHLYVRVLPLGLL